jgi:hypothetical protein
MGLLAYLGYWGSSDDGGVQDLAREQLVRETAHRVSKILSPIPGPAANQGTGPLHNKIRSKLGRGLDLPKTGKNLFVDLKERIAKEMNVSTCWVSRGALTSEEWPWKGISLNAHQLSLWNQFIPRQRVTNLRPGFSHQR